MRYLKVTTNALHFRRDKSGNPIPVATIWGPDRSTIDTLKEQCKQSDDFKCSSSQTGQGTFTNNPNNQDKGSGINEKFTH
jgi:hypothetical protein